MTMDIIVTRDDADEFSVRMLSQEGPGERFEKLSGAQVEGLLRSLGATGEESEAVVAAARRDGSATGTV